jgi:hypothetical protein
LALPTTESGNGDSDGDSYGDDDGLSVEHEGGKGDEESAYDAAAKDLSKSSHVDISSDNMDSRGEDERNSEDDNSDSTSAVEDARRI